MINNVLDFKDITEGPVFVDALFVTDIIKSGKYFKRQDHVFYPEQDCLLELSQDYGISSGCYDPFDQKTMDTFRSTKTFCQYYLAEDCGDYYVIYIVRIEPAGRFLYMNDKPQMYYYGENPDIKFVERDVIHIDKK